MENPSNRANESLPNTSLVACCWGIKVPLNILLKQFASNSLLIPSLQCIHDNGLCSSEVCAIVAVNNSGWTSSPDKSCYCINKAVCRQVICNLDVDGSIPEAGKNATIALVKFGILSHRSGKWSYLDVERSKIIYPNSGKRVDQLVAVGRNSHCRKWCCNLLSNRRILAFTFMALPQDTSDGRNTIHNPKRCLISASSWCGPT